MVTMMYGALLVPKIVLQVKALFLKRAVNRGAFSEEGGQTVGAFSEEGG